MDALLADSKEKEANTTIGQTAKRVEQLERELTEMEEFHENEIKVGHFAHPRVTPSTLLSSHAFTTLNNESRVIGGLGHRQFCR